VSRIKGKDLVLLLWKCRKTQKSFGQGHLVDEITNCSIFIINVYDRNIMLFVVTKSLENEFGTRHG